MSTNNLDQPQPKSLPSGNILSRLAAYALQESTFFRLHLTAFVFVPLIFSGIFYASNGRFHIDYIDSLFFCYSAMTDTGLTTANMSTLTAWQQVLLFMLMAMVSPHLLDSRNCRLICFQGRQYNRFLDHGSG